MPLLQKHMTQRVIHLQLCQACWGLFSNVIFQAWTALVQAMVQLAVNLATYVWPALQSTDNLDLNVWCLLVSDWQRHMLDGAR